MLNGEAGKQQEGLSEESGRLESACDGMFSSDEELHEMTCSERHKPEVLTSLKPKLI